MDSNGLRFWMLSDDAHWERQGGLQYDSGRRALRLASQRSMPAWSASENEARRLLDRVPQSIDQFGTYASWSPGGRVVATGAGPGEVTLFIAPAADSATDVAVGYDGILYVAIAGRVTLVDLRDRWKPVDAPAQPGFSAWRLASDPSGGVWALDSVHRKIARLRGLPLSTRPHPPYDPNTVRPCPENPTPPSILVESAVWDASETPVAIAASPDSRLALLTWTAAESHAQLRILGADGRFGNPIALGGALRPYSLTWVSSTLVAVLLPGMPEAPVFPVDQNEPITLPVGDIYSLRDHDGGPFLHGVNLPPHYPTAASSLPLYKLSLPSYARQGEAWNATTLDSGNASTVWHRLYIEAHIPEHCGIVVETAAVNKEDEQPAAWYPHRFGQMYSGDGVTPLGAWVPAASESPWRPSLLHCAQEKDRAGLFTALIQRGGLRTRSLRGRFLKLRVLLTGDGRATPELAAVRAYASRFSYVNRYLPELYREDLFGPPADDDGPSTPADFLERFLDNFEGVLTPLEDRIASSWLVTDADAAPEDALEWLGSWIGVSFDSAYSPAQRRQFIRSAPELFRRRGTVRGLALALDLATGGAVQRGQIVILEHYRLRRTFATILGANLDDYDDPLLAGIVSSGNSYVGDTLILGDQPRAELLALFRDSLPKTPAEAQAVDAFLDGLAYRITVLVHQEFQPQDLGLVRRVVDLETPAHVLASVESATHTFLTGVASLVGVDTYLASRPDPQPARIGVSALGRGDFIIRKPSLDPRVEGEDPNRERPVADGGPPRQAEFGQSFRLDASGSHAAGAKKIVMYRWTLLR